MPNKDKLEADAEKDAEKMRKDVAKLAAKNEQRVSKVTKLMKQIEREAKKK